MTFLIKFYLRCRRYAERTQNTIVLRILNNVKQSCHFLWWSCWVASTNRLCNRTFCCRYWSFDAKLVCKLFCFLSRFQFQIFESSHKNRFESNTGQSHAFTRFSRSLLCCSNQILFLSSHLNPVRSYCCHFCWRHLGYQVLVCFVLRTFQLPTPVGYGREVSRGLIRAV